MIEGGISKSRESTSIKCVQDYYGNLKTGIINKYKKGWLLISKKCIK